MAAARPLTWCSNMLPVNDLEGLLRLLERLVPELRRRLGLRQEERLPLGLWLGAAAVRQLRLEGPQRFAEWCLARGCYVLALNGFPYDGFHGASVRERVYRPDWRSRSRLQYTVHLAELLDVLLPAAAPGSISTVPVAWAPDYDEQRDFPIVRAHLLQALTHLDRLAQRSGRPILLALEPEPGCAVQTTEDVLRLFEQLRLPPHLRPLLGVCYDACHQAVLFEDPLRSLAALQQADIPLARVQASCAPLLRPGDPPVLLAPLAEETRYLHQTVRRSSAGGIQQWPDLSAALSAARQETGSGLLAASADEWRVHLHVPVFLSQLAGGLATTRPLLEALLQQLPPGVPVEVETYTWSLLPPALRGGSLLDSLVRELSFCKELLGSDSGTAGARGAGAPAPEAAGD